MTNTGIIKKILSLLLIIMLIMSTTVVFADKANIVMDKPSTWAKTNIDTLKAKGRLETRVFGDYQDNITRKDFAYLGVKLYEIITGETTSIGLAHFDDTEDAYVLKAKNAGFIDGVGNGLFEPDREITRDEIAALFVKLYGATGVTYDNGLSTEEFADSNEIADWAKDYVKVARANGIVNGVGENRFDPKAKATREVALIMYQRTIDKFEGSLAGQVVDNTEVSTVPDNEKGYNALTDSYPYALITKSLNPYRDTFPEWSTASSAYLPLYEYDKQGPSILVFPTLNDPIGYQRYTESEYPTMVSSMQVAVPTLETIQDVMKDCLTTKTMPTTTPQDWDRVYQTFTQKYAYPELAREPFDYMVADLLELFKGDRIPVEGYNLSDFGVLPGGEYSATYDLGNGLGGFIKVSDIKISIVVLPRDSQIIDNGHNTFLERVQIAKDRPDIMKYMDFR